MTARQVRHRRARHARRGIAAVELASLLPVILFLTLASIDFSRVVYALVTLQNCARNGALYEFNSAAGYGSTYTSLTQAVTADSGGLTLGTPTAYAPGYNNNNYVTVTVSCQFSLISIPSVGGLPALSGTMTLSQSSSMPYPASMSLGGSGGGS